MRPRSLLLLVLVLAGAGLGGVWWAQQDFAARNPGVADVAACWQAVREGPEDPSRWARLADAQTTVNQLRAAESSYRTALRLGAGTQVMGRLGMLLYGRGDDLEALRMLEAAQESGVSLPLLDGTLAQL